MLLRSMTFAFVVQGFFHVISLISVFRFILAVHDTMQYGVARRLCHVA